MSEEKRLVKNKKVLALSISLVVACVLAGVFGISFVIINDKYNDLPGDYGDYNELYADYLELLNDFNILEDQYSILTGEHIELENDYNALVIALADMTAERDALQSALDDLQLLYNALETERDGLLQDIIGLENTIADLNTQISNLNTQIVGLENTIAGLENTIADLNTQINDLNTQIANLNDIIAGLEDDNEALIQYYENIIIGLQAEINALTTERDGLISDLADMTVLRDNLQNELDALQLLYDDLIIERDNLQSALNDMTIERDNLLIDLAIMTAERDALQIELNNLTADYNTLLGDYQILSDAYDELQNEFNSLQMAYNYITDTIKQSILPVQYNIFAEAVRRYYMDMYLGGKTGKTYWKAFAEYCRDVILHDSWQENSFVDVSNAFSDALIFGNNTMYLADYVMYWTLFPWLPNWDGYDLSGNELTDIDTIVDWCIDEIDYEYDSDIIDGQEYFEWDYIKFPVETAFRTMGDCEDQAILCAAYLESCGFETAMIIHHDPSLEFYHGSLWVYIEDRDAFWSLYPDTLLWSIDGGINLWCWLDTTWDVPFGSTPVWLQYYIDYNIPLSWDIITLAICDVGGFVGTNVGENLGLTYVMPT